MFPNAGVVVQVTLPDAPLVNPSVQDQIGFCYFVHSVKSTTNCPKCDIVKLFDSSVLSIPIFLSFGWAEAGTSRLGWAILMLIIVTGIPLAYLVIGLKRG